MRTLNEIDNSAMDGAMPTHEECYYGMLAYRSLFNLDHHLLLKILMEKSERPAELKRMSADESHRRCYLALNKSPKEWLGPNNDPLHKEDQR